MPATYLRRATLASLLLAAAGCTAPPDALVVDPRVQPVRVELLRSFGVLRRRQAPVPLTECGFYESGPSAEGASRPYPEEVGRVVSGSSATAVPALRYGVVPPGFVQATPAGGAAPPLEPGRRYVVECSGDAIGSAEFEIPERPARAASPPPRRAD